MNTMCRFRLVGMGIALLGLSLSLTAMGCGPTKKGGPVTGAVTYQGKRLTMGTVRLHPKTGEPMTGGIDPEGNYTVLEVPPGDYRVSVETPAAAGGLETPKMSGPMPGIPTTKPPVYVPNKYNNPDSSGLTLEVKGNKGAKKDLTLD